MLVDGDTVYLYTGHDASTDEQVANSVYEIPEYLCYSSTDLVNWKSEGTVMTMDTVDWAKDDVSAWASQVMKYNDKYYLYYAAGINRQAVDRCGGGGQSDGHVCRYRRTACARFCDEAAAFHLQ